MKVNCLSGITFLVFVMGSFAMTFAQSTSEEYPEVCKTLNYYLEGGTNNDFEVLQKAFHANATMKSVNAEGYKEGNALEIFKEKVKPGPPQDRITRIVSVSISGNTANARLEAEYTDFTYIDYINLLKIEGEWKIVGKIFYKKEG
ncbi:nuclear transport factor 2 family protein [Sinomicrobium weinanense]|uniref:Nuclear transport factor 2 family protein n=1 Tax=Sinomicrobium weinanense TaxID=2842200 RepID=A0A926Q2U1_9FLAO|nr:nuclear transport factor 2 family protein [Sinomicrobium weinanense]MBC9795040.1 nuclear transport factor 2 family protein [Sinomicrobium weinanense]MBU3123831.1 nuclear transport factor 2 family protein [Sinomicrobium weinanense]